MLERLTSTQTPGCSGLERGYCVEQGPDWLAGLIVHPPGWFYAVVAGVLIAVALFAAAAWRREPFDHRDGREALASIAIVGCCGLGALAARQLLTLPYLVDLLGGWAVGGYVGVELASWIRATDDPDGEAPDRTEVTS